MIGAAASFEKKRRKNMKRIVLLLAVLFTPVWVSADSPHYLRADATLSTQDACYDVSLKEAGLGNSGFSSLTYTLSCTTSYSLQCFNHGGNQPQGVPKSGTSPSSAQTTLPIRNGQTNGTVSLCPSDVTLPDPGCTGNQIAVLIAASYSGCSLADSLGTPSPALPNLSASGLNILVD
jgi:hypothetical protein